MSIPDFNEWKETNKGKGINEYYEEFPDAKVQNDVTPVVIQTQNQKNESNWSIALWIILSIVVIGGVYLGMQKYNQSRLIKHQKKVEYHAPQRYLVVYNMKGNVSLLGKSIVKGTIENKSNHTTYVNIILAVEFYDKNGNYIKSEEVALGERMKPLDYNDFELKTIFPWKARTYKVRLASADVIRQKRN